MRINYRFAQLSKTERELLEQILMEEMDTQAWYVVSCSTLLKEEVILAIQ